MQATALRAIHAALLCCTIAACTDTTDPATYNISTEARPSDGGVVTGRGPYRADAPVHLQAIAAAGYLFANWTESDTVIGTAPDYSFVASRSRTLVANFTRQCSLTLMQSVGGTAALTAGASAGACGRSVTVTATPLPGFAFVGWSNGATTIALTFALNTDLILTPSFAAQCTLTLTQATGGTASVTAGSLTGNCGRSVNVTATAAADFAFSSWSNGATDNPLTLMLSADLALAPRFDAQCTLTLEQIPGGTATIASGSLTGNCGRSITLTATPSAGFAFAGWSNGATSSPLTIVLNANMVLRPSFVAQCSLTLLQGAGGTAAITNGSPTGNCGRPVTVTATAASGFVFSSWSNGATTNPLTLVMSAAVTLTPIFAAQCTLTFGPVTGGTVSVTNGALTGNCGRAVTVTAIPAANFAFSSWSNGATVNPLTVTLESDTSLTATFVAQCTLTLGQGPGGSAAITQGSATGNCGRSVTVTATPAPDFSFGSWSNGATTSPLTLTLNTNLTLTPNFIGQCTLTLSPATGGTTSVTAGSSTGACGREVTITAIASAGFAFVRWSNGFTANPLSITLTRDLELSPVFSSQCTLTLVQVPGGTASLTSGSLTGACGRSVTVTAGAAAGFVFTGWSNGQAPNPLTVAVNSDFSLSPTFITGRTLTVAALNNGAGSGTVTGPGISCTITNGSASGDCTGSYTIGANVVLVASPAGGGSFVGWAGACFGRASCQLTITGTTDVIVGFAPPVAYRLHGWDFSPFVDGQNPNTGAVVTLAQVRQRMLLIAGYADWIRGFGSTGGIEYVGQVAHELGKKAACGAWIDASSVDNEREITGLIASANAGHCDLLIVGSETQLRNQRNPSLGVPQSQLLSYIARVRQSTSGIPVTTADVYSILITRPAIVAAVDVLLANIYPFWEGYAIGDAMNVVHAARQQLQSVAGGKEVIVSETGWPSCGEAVGSARPTLQNANSYFLSLVSWARSTNTKYFYFAALAESWKTTTEEGERGACWGVFDKTGMILPGMRQVFDGASVPDTWSGNTIVGGPGTPSISFTHVPAYGNTTETLRGAVLHVAPAIYRVAVYIYVNGWWTKPTFETPITTIAADGTWESKIVTGGNDHLATEIVAYLIPGNYTPPQVQGQAALPSELGANSFPKVSVTRPP